MENFFENTERKIIEAIKSGVSPSIVVAVGDADGVYYKKAFGYERVLSDDEVPTVVFEGEIPDDAPRASLQTVYDMASLSKLLSTTMVTLKLLEAGEITLSDTVGGFFPEAPADKSGINIFQLLTHTSGIKAHFSLASLCTDKSEILKTILDHPLSYETGSRTEYTCMGFILLAHMLEKATGEGLDRLADRLVFEPLGMLHTGYRPLENKRFEGCSFAATEYSAECGGYACGVVHDENARFGGGVSGNAGVFSQIDDVIRFATMLSGRGEFNGGYYLAPSTFDMAIKNHTPHCKDYRGLGFDLSIDYRSTGGDMFSPLSYGHTGFTGPSLYVDRASGMYAAILTNRVHYTRKNSKHLRFRRMLHTVALCEYERMKKELSR